MRKSFQAPKFRRARRPLICPTMLVCLLASAAHAQPLEELPESPTPQTSAVAATGIVSGTVLDAKGDRVPNAKVALSDVSGKVNRVMDADAKGEFRFEAVPKDAALRITVTAAGLETFLSNEIKLAPGEHYVLPRIDLPMAPANSDITVTVTEEQLAAEQIKEQTKQRVLGVVPNFYTSFLWNAAPMKSKQKFRLALRATTDPELFIAVGIRAGISQARGTNPGYGDGFPGFASRYGAAYGDAITSRWIGRAILPAVFHQDPRYFYKGTGSTTSRIAYAMSRAIICRGDSGRNQPNYSLVLGNFAGAGLRNVYLAPEDRKGADVLLNGFILTGFNAASNLAREFLFRRLTTHVPDYKSGQPVGETPSK